MNKIKALFLLMFVSVVCSAQVDKIVGQWNTVDDKSGEKRSIVSIYKSEEDGLYYGKIEHLYEEEYRDAVCIPCEGEDHKKPVVGLVILRGMKYEDGVLQGGRLLDPESGNFYYGKISYDPESGKLKLRGSIDKRGWLGRTQVWERVK